MAGRKKEGGMTSEPSYVMLAEKTRHMLCIVDDQGIFAYVNPAWTQALGWLPSELIGTPYLAYVHPEDVEETLQVAAERGDGGTVQGYINRYRTKDGFYRDVRWWSGPDVDGYVYACAEDITEIQRSSSRAAEIEEVSGVCSWEVDMDTNTVYWSPGTRRLMGWDKDRQPTTDEAFAHVTEEGLAVLEPAFAVLLETGQPYDIEMRYRRTGGGEFLSRTTGAAEMRNDKVVRVYGTFEDITERREAERASLNRERALREAAESAFKAERHALKEQAWTARHDPLTGIGNRQLLEEVKANVADEYLAIAIDLDRFKHVNDSFGHEAGDHVLIETARRLKALCKTEKDKIFRIGGDEFVMLIEQSMLTSPPQDFCDWIVDQVLEVTDYHGVELRVGASVGFAWSSSEASLVEALKRADMALFEAKVQGRNRALAYTATIGATHFEKIELANDLKAAIEKGQINIVLQPQINASTGAFWGCEVLARWHHPVRGTISPGVFIPLADELNLLRDIDKYVLDQALAARSDLAARGLELPKIAVNVSAKRLHSSGLLEEITRRTDVPRNGLAFEILETAFIDEIDEDLRNQIDGLRAHGVRIEVDDFGTGHASFASVLALQPDVLKFDRMFVPGIDRDAGKHELMEGLIKIARNVGAETLVEGVETVDEMRALKALGVDYLQGFAIGRPMSVDDLFEWSNGWAMGAVA